MLLNKSVRNIPAMTDRLNKLDFKKISFEQIRK